MKIIDRYIFSEWLKLFVLSLFIILGLLLLEDMYNNFPDFISQNVPGKEILHYYGLLLPSFLPMMVPVGLLISILFVLGNMHRNNEIIAMQTAQMSILRITRSLIISSVLLTGGLFYLNAYYIPKATEDAREFEENLKRNITYQTQDSIVTHHNFTFDNRKDHRIWYMNSYNENNQKGYGVTVHLRNDKGDEVIRLQAREAIFDKEKGNWIFKDGRELYFDIKTQEPTRSLGFEEKIRPDINDSPKVMAALSKKPKVLSFMELKELVETIPSESNPNINEYKIRYHGILASPISCLIVTLLAIPFAVGGVRVNPIIGISKCAGLFFVYYLIINICAILGKQNIISPIIAAWTPNIIILAITSFLYRRIF